MDPILKFGAWDYLAPDFQWYFNRKVILPINNNRQCIVSGADSKVVVKYQFQGGKYIPEQERGITLCGIRTQ